MNNEELDPLEMGLSSYMRDIREEEEALIKEFGGCLDIMKGIPPHYSKQLYFNFEGEQECPEPQN